MRSRPALKLYLIPQSPMAGSRLRAEAVLDSESETPIDGVEFHLEGVERRHSGTSMVGSVPVAKYETIQHVNLFGRTPATTLSLGRHTFAMNFLLPPTAPPTWRSIHTTIAYTLSVRVVIPWWPDRVERYDVVVGPTPREAAIAPVSVCTDARGLRGTDLYIEASMDRTSVAPGEAVTGAVSIGNVQHHRVERVDLSFVAMERVAGSQDRGAEVERYTLILHEGRPADSKPIPFRAKFPPKAQPAFRGALTELRWHAELAAVISFGSDVTLSIPIDVVCRPAGTPAVTQPSRVPPIGSQRRAMVWATVASRHGFVNDAQEERMFRELGDGAIEITLEPRREGGIAIVARVRFAPLGIELSVQEKRWTDLVKAIVRTGNEAFDDRFTTRGREEAQVRAFLDQAGCEGLLGYERVSIDDGGATLSAACAAQSVEELSQAVGKALSVARTLVDAASRVPPPASMTQYVAEWRELARLINGRLQIGCMAIRGGMFDHFPLELATEWDEDAQPGRTVARLAVPGERAALDGHAAGIAAEVSKAVGSLEITAEGVEATLPAPLHDQAAILLMLEGMARIARAIEVKTSLGPYR